MPVDDMSGYRTSGQKRFLFDSTRRVGYPYEPRKVGSFSPKLRRFPQPLRVLSNYLLTSN